MATQHSRSAARMMMAPAVILLLGWMLVPLTMTLYFSFKKFLPLRGGDLGWVGFELQQDHFGCPFLLKVQRRFSNSHLVEEAIPGAAAMCVVVDEARC